MSTFTSFVPRNNLAALLLNGGGITAAEAVARASQRLEDIRARCIAALEGTIDDLAAEASSAPCPARTYSLAAEIYNLAGTFGLADLAGAAESLCVLLADRAALDGPHAHEEPRFLNAIRVHVEALQTLRRLASPGDGAGRCAIVHGLRLVTSRYASNEEG